MSLCVCGCGNAAAGRSKWAAEACRKRAWRDGRQFDPVRVVTVKPPAPKLVPVVPDAGMGCLEASVRAKLAAVDRLEEPAAITALVLAARMDRGVDTASSLAAAAKQLSLSLAEALEGTNREVSALDKIRAERDARRHA